MTSIDEYAKQSAYSDPGPYAALFDALPSDVRGLTEAIRNTVVHYRSGIELSPERMAEIDHRWIDRLLETDQKRMDAPLAAPRSLDQRVAGCCRDFTLLTVAALRHKGIPARSRVGFAGYFGPPWHHDHVIVDYWDGQRWVFVDPQLDPGADWPFDAYDMPRLAGAPAGGVAPPAQPFVTAAQVWTAHRRGEIDVETYGVAPDLPIRGDWFVHGYVIMELAHRRRDEMLLWDVWGAMCDKLGPDEEAEVALVDEVAALLLAADAGDSAAEEELAERYDKDDRLKPGGTVRCESPTGKRGRVNLTTRARL